MNYSKINNLIEGKREDFTSTEITIAEFVKENPEQLNQMTTISKFSEETGFSTGSIVRFCKKLGFDGYSEFKFFISNNLLEIELGQGEDYLIKLVDIYLRELSLFKSNLNTKELSKLSKLIVSAQSIIIVGKNSSYVAAYQLQMRLNKLGIRAIAIQDDITIYNYTNILNQNDLVILFSVFGSGSNDYPKMINDFQVNNIPIYVISFENENKVSNVAQKKVLLPSSVSIRQNTGLDNQILFLMFIEILIHKIVNKYY